MRERRPPAGWDRGKEGQAHHVCPLHVHLKEPSDLLFQQPGLLDVGHTVVKVCLEPSDQRFCVPLLQAEALAVIRALHVKDQGLEAGVPGSRKGKKSRMGAC